MNTSRSSGGGRLGEFQIIARYFAPLTKDVPGALGLADDAARFTPPEGTELVLTADMLVAGVHFRAQDRPEDIGWKALAVNVADLIAKGARPAVYLLSLALPKAPDESWIDALARGFAEAQSAYDCRLIGGDTTATPGPVTVSVSAIGIVAQGASVSRAGAHAGDQVYISGTVGDAALGLLVLEDAGALAGTLGQAQRDWLARRYLRPRPPAALAPILGAHASAAMDVSDGLAGDFAKLCAASGTGGEIHVRDVPLSEAARAALQGDASVLESLLTGGDDYEVLCAVPAAQAEAFEAGARKVDVAVSRIGCIRPAADGVFVVAPDGGRLHFACGAYDHF